MFKSGKNAKPAKKAGGGTALMQQMGFQMPNVDGPGDDDDDDDDLEAELQRLQQGGGGQGARRSKANQPGAAQNLQAFHKDVNKLLHDIDQPINDDDLSDVDDEDLLAELNEITEEIDYDSRNESKAAPASSSGNILSVLQGRLEMYEKALAASKANNDSAKARRLDRQLKSIQELIQSVRAGGTINESDIPPEVFVASQAAPAAQQVPIRPASPPPRAAPQAAAVQLRVVPKPTPPPAASVPVHKNTDASRPSVPTTANNTDREIEKLKALALQAKQRGDMAKAKDYILQLRALQGGATASASSMQKETYDNIPDDDGQPPPPLPLKAPEPRTVMEALQQRHEELTKRGEEAAARGDTSKARRMERLSKQYNEAIDATKKNRAYDYSELPDIPGFAPIPVQTATAQPRPTAKPGASNPQARSSQPAQHRAGPAAPITSSTTTRKNQQAQTLRLKQEKFHKLAAQAKQQGDIETAKKFLIAYKGLEQMIQAAEAGFPIDMSQVPRLPDDDGDVINDDDLTQDLAHADRDTIYHRLQDDLLRQIQLCARNQQTYSQMEGSDSIKHANEYKVLEKRCTQDLENLRQCFQQGVKPPLFHYERRQMNIVQVNHELGDNDFEVTVLRGINLPIPSGHSSPSLETYVVIEFPYPTETPQTARTRHVAGSTNAEYPDGQHKFYIKRLDAKFKRLMNRKELKFAVFYKPGFLRSDRPLGVASIKLAALEQSCTIHESVDLFEPEHKKKIEGKLEVKLRIKEALGQTKASDILPQRWLVIDRFEEIPRNTKASSSNRSNIVDPIVRQPRRSHQQPPPEPVSVPVPVSISPQSVQVLNYEASMLKENIEKLHGQLSSDQLHQLQKKLRTIEEQSDRLVDSLRMGGKPAVQEHLRGLEELIHYYDQEARESHQRRDTKKADTFLLKKKLVMKEMGSLAGQPPAASSTRF